MSLHPRPGRVLAEDETPDSGVYSLGPGQPISQVEIDDIALDEARPIEDRIARLRELRDRVAPETDPDFADSDVPDILAEIDGQIAALSQEAGYAAELGELSQFDGGLSIDPEDRLDLLAPDDEDGRHRIEDGVEDIADEEADE
jgi:hypothetical protein